MTSISADETFRALRDDNRPYTEWASVSINWSGNYATASHEVTEEIKWCLENVGTKGREWTFRPLKFETNVVRFYFRHDHFATMFRIAHK